MKKLLTFVLFVSLLIGIVSSQESWNLGSSADWLSGGGPIINYGQYYPYTSYYYPTYHPTYLPIYYPNYYSMYYPNMYYPYSQWYINHPSFPLGTFGIFHGGNYY